MKTPLITKSDIPDVATVVSFLVHCEIDNPGMMYGSWKIEEAIDALAKLLRTTPEVLRNIPSAASGKARKP